MHDRVRLLKQYGTSHRGMVREIMKIRNGAKLPFPFDGPNRSESNAAFMRHVVRGLIRSKIDLAFSTIDYFSKQAVKAINRGELKSYDIYLREIDKSSDYIHMLCKEQKEYCLN